jgi:hypothetical protein
MKSYQVARLLAYVTGLINQELLLQVEYLAAENRILRAHAPIRLRLSIEQRSTLAEIGGQRYNPNLRIACKELTPICLKGLIHSSASYEIVPIDIMVEERCSVRPWSQRRVQ